MPNGNVCAQENTRLQSKIVRLNLGTPTQTNAEAEVEDLKEENAELREDNDKLVRPHFSPDNMKQMRSKTMKVFLVSRPLIA